MPTVSKILLIDDNPSHLTLYSLILKQAGFHATSVLVDGDGVEFPVEAVDLVLLDYRLGMASSIDVAKKVQSKFPRVPIIVLSDMQWMPDDIAPFATTFVRKGEPEQLLATVASTLDGAAS
jgi:DNA-binding response OmpR family regulator